METSQHSVEEIPKNAIKEGELSQTETTIPEWIAVDGAEMRLQDLIDDYRASRL